MGDAGAEALAGAIRSTPSLQRLNLNFNSLSGAALAAIAEALLAGPGARR